MMVMRGPHHTRAPLSLDTAIGHFYARASVTRWRRGLLVSAAVGPARSARADVRGRLYTRHSVECHAAEDHASARGRLAACPHSAYLSDTPWTPPSDPPPCSSSAAGLPSGSARGARASEGGPWTMPGRARAAAGHARAPSDDYDDREPSPQHRHVASAGRGTGSWRAACSGCSCHVRAHVTRRRRSPGGTWLVATT